MRKNISFKHTVLLALLLAVCAFVLPASAEVTENGLCYTVYDTYVAITGYTGNEETLVIPSMIDGLPVTSVIAKHSEGNATIENKSTKTIVLPETVVTLGWDSFARMTALTKVEGLEYVQELAGYNFGGTQVKEMLFSDALRDVGPQAFECGALVKLRIPDDVTYDRDFSFVSMFRYNTSLTSIELIETGNPPTLVKDGPALYTADMKTLIIYPCGYKGNLSYRIPEGVEELAINAFDIRSAYVTDGLMDVVVPASVKKVYENTFYTGLYVAGPGNGTSEHFVMPHLHVYEDSVIASYCESMGYTYFIRSDETVTIGERIRQIVNESVTDGMSDYEKAFALNQWLVENVVYDNTLTHYTADSILFEGTGVCQSFALTYEMLLNYVGIESRQYPIEDHIFTAVYLNGEWCYVDTTWNNNGSDDCYFGMNADMVGKTYGLEFDFDTQAVGSNDGYRNYHPYQRGEYDEYLSQGKALLQAAVESGESELEWTAETLLDLRDAYLPATLRAPYFDAALLAAYLREQSFGEEVYLSVKYDLTTEAIAILISHGDPLPEDFEFSRTAEGVRIDRYTGSDVSVTVPETILGLPVVEIGSNAFDGCGDITSLTLPDTITRINDSAFFLCESLMDIELPIGLKYIGDAAFGDCYALETIVLPSGLTQVGANLFFQCTSLQNVTIPDSLTEMGLGMFSACYVLESVKLPAGMTRIPDDLFWGCDNLREVEIPAGIESIGKYAFVNTALTSLTLPEGLEYIDEYAFLGCKLSSLTLPSTVKELAAYAFQGSSLTEIDLNEGLERIGYQAFYGTPLSCAEIPSTVTQVGDGCFQACPNLETVAVAKGNASYTVRDNILYSADMTTLMFSPVANSGAVNVPASVRIIAEGAFHNNTLVTSITFAGPLSSLGKECFTGCSALTELAIPQGVTELPFGCMWACSSLEKVTLPDSLVTIGDWAFMECRALTGIDLPDSVTSIEKDAFHCPLTSFRMPEAMTSLPDNTLSNTQVNALYVHPKVTYIGLNNLYGVDPTVYGVAGTYAESFALANGYAFEAIEWEMGPDSCLTLPADLVRIEAGAFIGTAAELVVIPEGCTFIGANAFADSSLASACIPASVTDIGAAAFDAGVTLITPQGSYAWQWGTDNGYTVVAE